MAMKKCVGGNHVKKGRNSNGRILELPEPIIMDILSRVVPIDTIFCCRCVCKTFLNILKDPYFVEVHLAKALNATYSLIVQPTAIGSRFYFTNVTDPNKLSVSDYNGFCPWKRLIMPDVITQNYQKRCVYAALAGSCNGLICLSYVIVKPYFTMYCVCNPILGEFMVLPKPWPLVRLSGFGFCPKTKQYKVIRFTSSLFAEIHTLGTNCWRNIGYVPEPHGGSLIDYSCLDGKYPYLTNSPDLSHLICFFNFETEQYSYIPPPPYFDTHDTVPKWRKVEILSGLLCFSYMPDNFHFEVCVMNDFGVKESWTKKFTIDMRLNCMSTKGPDRLFSSLDIRKLIILKLINNGDMLITYYPVLFPLLYYSPKKRTICDISGFSQNEKEREIIDKYGLSAIDLAPSFVSLKDIGGEVWKSSREHTCTTSYHTNDFDYINFIPS